MSDDPWSQLAPPTAAGALNTRRVDPDNRWDFFWARSIDRSFLLVLHHNEDSAPKGHLPKPRGIEVSVSEGVENGMKSVRTVMSFSDYG